MRTRRPASSSTARCIRRPSTRAESTRSCRRSGRPRRRPITAWSRCSRVHAADYLDFLRTAHDEWRAAGREGDAFPYTFPVVGRRPLNLEPHRRAARPVSVSTPRRPIAAGPGMRPIGRRRPRLRRWTPCSAASARPSPCAARPATMPARDYLGGYSYLSNAAIAAEHAARSRPAAGRDPRRRLSSRQRHAGHLLRPRRRRLRLDPCRPGDRLSLLLGPCGRSRGRRGRRRDAQPAAAARHRLDAAMLPALDQALDWIDAAWSRTC